jgi:hypothetical protein
MTDKKYCTACQGMRSIEGGQTYKRKTTTRWVCNACVNRKNESIYASKATRERWAKERMERAA